MIKIDTPKSISTNGSTIANQVKFLNIFNNYWATMVEKTKENVSPLQEDLLNFLRNKTHSNFFLSPSNNSEIQSILFSLDSNKSAGPNSIPINILKLLKNDF